MAMVASSCKQGTIVTKLVLTNECASIQHDFELGHEEKKQETTHHHRSWVRAPLRQQIKIVFTTKVNKAPGAHNQAAQ